jgi:hypothetical protein
MNFGKPMRESGQLMKTYRVPVDALGFRLLQLNLFTPINWLTFVPDKLTRPREVWGESPDTFLIRHFPHPTLSSPDTFLTSVVRRRRTPPGRVIFKRRRHRKFPSASNGVKLKIWLR